MYCIHFEGFFFIYFIIIIMYLFTIFLNYFVFYLCFEFHIALRNVLELKKMSVKWMDNILVMSC